MICSEGLAGIGGGLVNSISSSTMQNIEAPVDGNVLAPSTLMATPGINNAAWNRQQAVSVRHAFKTYGSSKNPNHVIQNLSMTVAKGSM